MNRNRKEWLGAAAFAIASGLFMGAAIAVFSMAFPRCEDVTAITVGGSFVLAGCVDSTSEPRLIYRNDGSVTPP